MTDSDRHALEQWTFDAWPPAVVSLFDGTALERHADLAASLIVATDEGQLRTTLLSVGEIYARDARTLLFALWPQSRAARAIRQRRAAALTLVADRAFFQAQLKIEPLEGDFGGLAGFAATIVHGDAQRVGYARVVTGVTFALEGERAAVLARWQRQIEHLRRAAAQLQ
ncbi:hypothetical protein KDW36_14810 [Burkholderia dolosa]|uniref:hypothetical protein n=1 Tax=Burkholderia dolosa TaxID=152500 RepID=UPI001B9A8E40|nr:hypothetical protein [Burkholderia dolosa]MBR8314462.1 hypothetical protein [Burkholderia dolosa]MBR8457751.1 hypothetical protein [Burkholderia dolosa]MBY4831277.1 hypothetical protein [Burkholderia dolosa]MDN7421508.1 hypothetical protein [Burkholderia dolosa]